MWITLSLLLALGASPQAPSSSPNEALAVKAGGGGSEDGCCSYRKAAGEEWICIETAKATCEEAVKKHNVPHKQWHFTKGKKCAENKDCLKPVPKPIERQ